MPPCAGGLRGVSRNGSALYPTPSPPSCEEYALLWLTFAAIMRWGLEGGIGAGILLACLYFAHAYARSQVKRALLALGQWGLARSVR